MADPRDLVTKAAVEGWLNSNNPGFNTQSDTVNIPLAITDCSVDWLSFTGRQSLNRFVPRSDFMDGSGSDRQFLPEFPVGLVSAVYINGTSIPQGGFNQNGSVTIGWTLDRKRESLSLVGGCSWGMFGQSRGAGGAYAATGGPLTRTYGGYSFGAGNDSNRQNVQVQYFAGGAIMFNEVQTVPASPFQFTASQGAVFWNDLNETFYATPQNGQLVQLTPVSSSPAAGQYSVSAAGVYTFNSADQNQPIGFSYGYNAAMPDIQMACIMQVVETLFTRQSAGLKSQGTPETGTTSFSKVARPDRVLMVMMKYKRGWTGM